MKLTDEFMTNCVGLCPAHADGKANHQVISEEKKAMDVPTVTATYVFTMID